MRSDEQIQRRLFDPIGKVRHRQRSLGIVNRKSVFTFVMCANAGLASVCAVYTLGEKRYDLWIQRGQTSS